jgi:SecD/SecF fusion protein
MKNHRYRSLLILASIILSLLIIYPTIGWMLKSPEARAEATARFKAEDEQRALNEHGYWDNLAFKVKRWAECHPDQVITLGLDLQGGIQMVVSLDWTELPQETIDELRKDPNTDSDEEIAVLVQETVFQQLVNRINEFEAKEPIIQKLGDRQIQVQLPGEKDVDRAMRLIQQVANLDFNIVAGQDETVRVLTRLKQAYPEKFTAFIERPAPGEPVWVKAENYENVEGMIAEANSRSDVVPEDKMLAFSRKPKPGDLQRYSLYVLDRTPIHTGEGLTSASAGPDPQNPAQWAISFTLQGEGAAKFGEATEANLKRNMAIVLDGQVVSAPTIQGRIDFNGQITGNFDAEEAKDLAIALNSGSILVKPHEDSTEIVSATLGADSVKSGVTSALWGLLLVGIFVVIYYMIPGGVALLGLAMNAVYVLAAMAYFDMTLTLPGIAGLILTIGMAVDANVLIFERIREELKLGHTIKSAVDTGFNKAASAILDSNITTFIAALVLFQFGTGAIEGFAITLSIGVCASVFTALVVCRAVFDLMVEKRTVKTLKMLNAIPDNVSIPFMGIRRYCGVTSAILVIAGISFFGFKLETGEVLGVDFTQGTNLRVNFHQDSQVDIAGIRTALNDAGFAGPTVQQVISQDGTATNTFQVRVGDVDPEEQADSNAPTVADRLRTAMSPLVGGDASKVDFESVKTVGPAVGAQLKSDAIWAIVWSLVFISIYLGYRFHMNYAAGAMIALIHDVCITLGLFALLGRQINLPVVAAILTIIGYSLNDTIVVFDRIREDVDVLKGRGKKLMDIIDIAINSTLSRTLLTSLTTLFVCFTLFLFGGEAIEDFALALIIGIVVGTYSSIFVASPVVLVWDNYFGRGPGGDAAKHEDAGRRYISSKKKKRAKKSDADGEADGQATA